MKAILHSKFIEDVPTDWEETKVVDGKIGEFVTTFERTAIAKIGIWGVLLTKSRARKK